MKWPVVQLRSIVTDIQPGFAQQPNRDGKGLPHLRTNNVSEDGRIDLSVVKTVMPSPTQLKKYSLKSGDILFNNTNSARLVGKTAIFDEQGQYLFSNHMTRIRVCNKVVQPQFLAIYLHSIWLNGGFHTMVTQWVNQAAINVSQLSGLSIPLPPLSEQQQIVKILDRADALRRKRAEVDARMARILPALFNKMFGDPATNPKGWKKGNLDSVITETQYGTSTRASDKNEGVAIIRMNNIDSAGRIDLTNLKYIILEEKELKKYKLERGDLLFNRTNSAELVGKTGLWTNDIEAVFASYLIRFRLDDEKALPEYIWAYMNTPFMKQLLFDKARRAIGMANINAQELRALPLVLPDLETQSSFTSKLESLNFLYKQCVVIKDHLESLFQLLLHRAFSGDLTAGWRETHRQELLAEMEEQARLLEDEPVQLSLAEGLAAC